MVHTNLHNPSCFLSDPEFSHTTVLHVYWTTQHLAHPLHLHICRTIVHLLNQIKDIHWQHLCKFYSYSLGFLYLDSKALNTHYRVIGANPLIAYPICHFLLRSLSLSLSSCASFSLHSPKHSTILYSKTALFFFQCRCRVQKSRRKEMRPSFHDTSMVPSRICTMSAAMERPTP